MDEKRRQLVKGLLGGGCLGCAGGALYSITSFLQPPALPEENVGVVKAGLVSDFPPNSGQIVKFGRTPVLLICTEAGTFRAFSAVCTHLDCLVQYRDDTKLIWCACHNGRYDLDGINIAGPPPRPLTEFAVNIVNNEVMISRPPVAEG